MSFAIYIVGKPDALKRRLAEESERLTNQSKAEFDAVRPAIEAVIDANMPDSVISVNASGHAYFEDGVKKQANCAVKVEPCGGFVE